MKRVFKKNPYCVPRFLLMTTSILLLTILVLVGYNYVTFNSRIRQKDARNNLKIIYLLESQYYNNYNEFAESFRDIKISKPEEDYYNYYLFSGDNIHSGRLFYEGKKGDYGPISDPEKAKEFISTFRCIAVAIGNIDTDLTEDIIGITKEGKIVHIQNDFWK